MIETRTIVLDDPRDFLVYRPGSGDTVEILDIQVGSERRQGRGRKPVEHLLRNLPPETNLVWAITRANNLAAQGFYERLRFRVVAVLRNFYGTRDEDGKETVDAIMYGKDIKR